MATEQAQRNELPDWVLAFGPFLVIGVLILLGFGAYTTFEFDWLAVEGTASMLVVLTGIGIIAGILPVAVGMLWFPYFRRLEAHWVHAVLAFSAGILAFIAVEMASESVSYAAQTVTPALGGGVAVVGAIATVGAMELLSRWRKRKTAAVGGDGLTVAYLVAIGLGLHSIGEGLAIGTAFVGGDMALVVLFTVGFILHNVTEGPAVIAAVARERMSPPLYHFAVLGLLAGGGVILGGWIGSFAYSPMVATIFFAVAAGAIVQVTWEMFDLVRTDAETVFDRRIVAAFVIGVVVLFVLEEIIVEGYMGL